MPDKTSKQQELRRRLDAVQTRQKLGQIFRVAQSHNDRLKQEAKELRAKVEAIITKRMESQDAASTHGNQLTGAGQQVYRQIKEAKKELRARYNAMVRLKQEIAAKSGGKIEEAEHNKIRYQNELATAQKEIKQAKKQLEVLKATNTKLESTIEANNKEDSVNRPKMEDLQQQNRQLREQISRIRKSDYQQQHESRKVQKTLVGIRAKQRQQQRRTSMHTLKASALTDQKQLIAQEYNSLRREVSMLKEQVSSIAEQSQAREMQVKLKNSDLRVGNTELIKKLKQADQLKCKLEQENNLWKKKWNQINRVIESRNNKVKTIDLAVQATPYEDPQPLRREYAGMLSRQQFDDRQILREDKHTRIVGMMVYETERGLASVQALYSNGEKGSPSIPQHFIERCRASKIECSQGDFFKLLKVKYSGADSRITKIEIRSNRNIKYQFGEKKPWSDFNPSDTVYGFDIGIKEYPVCLFGSYNYAKGTWLLEGLGVEVNELAD